jgi:hypothetical protein
VAVLIDLDGLHVVVELPQSSQIRYRATTDPPTCITALITFVTHACPSAESGGCSLLLSVGTTHDTEGNVPLGSGEELVVVADVLELLRDLRRS